MLAILQLNKKTQLQINAGINDDIPDKIQTEVNRQLNIFGCILKDEIIPGLKENGIHFYYKTSYTRRAQAPK